MNKLILFITSVLLLIPVLMLAQRTISGTVTEQATGEPLPGVSILIEGTQQGTTTDFDGKFLLDNVTEGSVLQFSYVGYETQTVSVTTSNIINVAMVESAEALEEVVVIGYGTAKKEDLTGSVDLITTKDFNKGAVVSAQQLITGKIAGVSVTSGGGAPGEGQDIIVRGLSSLSLNHNPLYVIDGVPISDGGVGGARNILNLINPNDIESMVVLKDASATAIYGSRAANGVVMITTKKGRDRDFTFNFNSKTSVYDPYNSVDVMTADEFKTLVESTDDSDAIARIGNANTDWQNEIYRGAIGHEHNLSALGTAFGIPLRTSVGYANHEGILKKDNFERLTGFINLSPVLLDNHLKIEFNARGTYIENEFANKGAIDSAIQFDPTQAVYDSASPFAGFFTWIDPTTSYQYNLAPTNPIAQIELVDDLSYVRRFIGNIKFDYKLPFFSDITATVNLGYDRSKSKGSRTTSKFIPTSNPTFDGSLTTYKVKATNQLLDAYLTYSKESDKHSINAVGGYSYQKYDFDDSSFDSENFEENPDTYDGEDTLYRWTLLSYFGRLNYTYDGKYLLTATLRADASSKLNPEDRWGYFPSVALAWNIHKEDFMDNTVFDELKLRVGYGEVGNVNGLGDYLYLTRYSGSTPSAYYQFGDAFYQTYRPDPVNKNLKWEIGKTTNIGVDYSLFNRRLYGSVNVYKKETKDLIVFSLVDPFTNFGNRIDNNVGNMENKGIEIALNAVPVKTVNLDWTINYNVAFNDNLVTFMPDAQAVGGISGGVGNNIQSHTVCYSPYSFLVYQQVYDHSGKPIEGVFVDRNEDDIINDDDRYFYKDPIADIIMGLSSSVKYNNIDFSITTRANFGNYMYDNVASSKSYLRRATENNILSNLHSDYFDTGFRETTENNLLSDHFIQNASFFKIDNITLGVSFPDLLKGAKLRFYGAVQNVATITNYTGLDPEIFSGIDNNFYPRPRTYTLGLNIDF